MPGTFDGPEAFFEQRNEYLGQLRFHADDPTATVVVLDQGTEETRTLIVNGKPDGHIESDYPTMALTGLIPALLAERHQRCFVIGWGLGVTAGELAALEETREVQAAEISHGVLAAAPLFEAGNLGAAANPKVEILQSDAYRALLNSRGHFDVIVSEPSNPWVTGVEMLYSREFLESARDRLTPGGAFGQWFHVYESDVETVALVLRTYASVFPHVSVWFTQGVDLLLLGFREPERALDVRALEARFVREDFAAGFGRAGIEGLAQLLAHEILPLGTLHASELPGPIHTLRHPILSYKAARAFFGGGSAWLPPYLSPAHEEVALRNSLLRRLAGGNGSLSEELLEAAVAENCRFRRFDQCATFLARWAVDHPGSPRLETALARARKRADRREGHLRPQRLAGIRALYSGRLRSATDGASLRQAERLTQRFVRHYHHAVPFDRSVLDKAWGRCAVEACQERRRLAERRIGPMDEEEEFGASFRTGAGLRRVPEPATTRTEAGLATADPPLRREGQPE